MLLLNYSISAMGRGNWESHENISLERDIKRYNFFDWTLESISKSWSSPFIGLAGHATYLATNIYTKIFLSWFHVWRIACHKQWERKYNWSIFFGGAAFTNKPPNSRHYYNTSLLWCLSNVKMGVMALPCCSSTRSRFTMSEIGFLSSSTK